MAPQQVNLPDEELDWIQLRKELSTENPETMKEKMVRKIKDNPIVPAGCLLTAGVLGFGLYNFYSGNRKMSQMMMRGRILAQGFTLTALIFGVVMGYQKE